MPLSPSSRYKTEHFFSIPQQDPHFKMMLHINLMLSLLATFASADRDTIALIIGGQSPDADRPEDFFRTVEVFGCLGEHNTKDLPDFPFQGEKWHF